MVGALLLRPATYREVAVDESAGIQAGLLIVIVGVTEGAVRSTALVYSVLAALIGWLVWSAVVSVVAGRLFNHPIAFRVAARAVAFAHAPALVYGLAAVVPSQWEGLVWGASLLWFAAALVACVEGLLQVALSRALGVTATALVTHEVIHQALFLAGLMG